jgi:hypothetical protein
MTVSGTSGRLRFWRNTAVATQAHGHTMTIGQGTLGYEWDRDIDNGVRPAGLVDLSTTSLVGNTSACIFDAAGCVHHLVEYRASSGALVFGAGTVQWAWGLDPVHDVPAGTTTPAADPTIRQATVNLLADMGAQPATLNAGLVAALPSTDTTPPKSKIKRVRGAPIVAGQPVTIAGHATDVGGRVAGVTVSIDGGATWHPTIGTTSWTYTFVPRVHSGAMTIESRATDDSLNTESPGARRTLQVTPRTCPCTVFDSAATPGTADSGAGSPTEVGLRFTTDTAGTISAIRFYKSDANTGPHRVDLWDANGNLLATAMSGTETASGWQPVTLPAPVAVAAGATYVASYVAPSGHAADDLWYSTLPSYDVQPTGVDATPLHMLAGVAAPAGTIGFPTESTLGQNYWVDVSFS